MSVTPRRLTFCVLASLAAVGIAFPSCSGKTTSLPVLPVFGNVIPLTAAEVELIISRAVASIDSPVLHVAVVARTGDILGAYSVPGFVVTDEDNIAVNLARTTGFFSNSQAPLSSRTVETLSTFHFPPTFDVPFISSQVPVSSGVGTFANTVIAPNRTTTGIAGTPQGPLWQIQATNRGANIATNLTNPPTAFNIGFEFFPSRNLNGSSLAAGIGYLGGTFPSPGIVSLPGAVPLYKPDDLGVSRLVGGIGVFVRQSLAVDPSAVPDVAAAEFAAIQGASGTGAAFDPNFFFSIPTEGAITIAGILLPYVKQTTRPANVGPGTFPFPPPGANWVAPTGGRADPFNYLIGPRGGVNGFSGQLLTQTDVTTIINQVVASANITRGQVRLPLGSGAKVIATVVDTRGLILAHFRMEDTLCDAIDVVPAKARSVVYYCQPGGPALADQWPGFPIDPTGQNRGIALTTRTLGFLAAPFYPPGIDSTAPGPLFNLARQNQLPAQVDRWGNAPPDPGYQNGLTFFPGSVPLYKGGQLVGALGVSGDGVEQNDLIAFDGGRGFEPPAELRIDNFTFNGVRLPYLKFPQTPR
ncbi:MAG: heme-binding protein [Planctomycetota bacterium]